MNIKARLLFTLLVAASLQTWAQTTRDPLKQSFMNPPDSARPRVWWHWMNGNISEQGIKLDLEWMKRTGLAGFQNFDAALETPQIVEKRLAYMTPEWKKAFRFAVQVGADFGLEEAIAGSPGWSESGGPWVIPSHGMKKYVWSETYIKGGKPFRDKIAHPPTETGPFQNLTTTEAWPQGADKRPSFYADAAVIAFRRPGSEVALDAVPVKVTSSQGEVNASVLSDGDLLTGIPFVVSLEGTEWVQVEYAQAQTVRSVTFASNDPSWTDAMMTGNWPLDKHLEVSDDGLAYHPVADLNATFSPQRTVAFSPVTGRFFRITFRQLKNHPETWAKATPGPRNYLVTEFVLHPDAWVDHFEAKAGFVTEPDLYPYKTADSNAVDVIRKKEVIDLRGKVRDDGTLEWTPPEGDWVVLRIGYSLLGITNHPATNEATGLEVDKLDRRYVKDYFEKYLDSYKDAVGTNLIGHQGIHYVINDSWEAGPQNWTDNILQKFRELRGYDPMPWLPVLSGHVVESSEASDGFLWDFRKTIADLTATEHYGQLESSLHDRGMEHYGESHESGRALIADGMEVKKFNEIPMSAMWTQSPGLNREMYGYDADDRESASVAHIYGQNLAAAESMTASSAPWGWSPATLKPTADAEFLNGINRIVIHESAHQPVTDKVPGLTLGQFGQWFNRNETWAEDARPWVDYLTRTSFLLQQGRFVADVLYFYGEDSNLSALFGDKGPDVPMGYGYDYINADALEHEVTVINGRISTRHGMNYRILALDPYSRHMSLPVLRAIHELAMQGAIIAGPKPTDDPSLADDHAEFRRLANEVFGDQKAAHTVGKGKVFTDYRVGEALVALNIPPDFEYSTTEPEKQVRFVHRAISDGDLYFVNNRQDAGDTVLATFRVAGKVPEIWHPETGATETASYRIVGGKTIVSLIMEPWGSVFVVFRKSTKLSSAQVPTKREESIAALEGPWTVQFQQGRGAPDSTILDHLESWTNNSDRGVKYFSGTGTYSNTIVASEAWFQSGSSLWIDFGTIRELAHVYVNGKDLGVVWHNPFRIDVTSSLKPGRNELIVKVTNLWVNRMIGDQQPGAAKITWADVTPYQADSPLVPAGLLGPVRIVRTEDAAPPQ